MQALCVDAAVDLLKTRVHCQRITRFFLARNKFLDFRDQVVARRARRRRNARRVLGLFCLNNWRGAALLRYLGVRNSHIPVVAPRELTREEALMEAALDDPDAAEVLRLENEHRPKGLSAWFAAVSGGLKAPPTGLQLEIGSIIGNRAPWCTAQAADEFSFYSERPEFKRCGVRGQSAATLESRNDDEWSSDDDQSSSNQGEDGGTEYEGSVRDWTGDSERQLLSAGVPRSSPIGSRRAFNSSSKFAAMGKSVLAKLATSRPVDATDDASTPRATPSRWKAAARGMAAINAFQRAGKSRLDNLVGAGGGSSSGDDDAGTEASDAQSLAVGSIVTQTTE